MKFGGSSVADADKIKNVARRIAGAREEGDEVLAVVSARGKTTDGLVALAREISDRPDPREMDMLLSTGERISCALMAMALHDLGHEARSFTGSQAGIVTDAAHTNAKIVEIRADRLREALGGGHIVLVAGFQGVSTDRNVTTLGRGGSDTTAVALATALGAHVCEIYTDVTGVFTADPRIEPGARKLSLVSHEEMLEMAATGSRVLALRSVEFARRHDVPLHVRSSFQPEEGTWITKETPGMEKAIISGVSHKSDEAKITITGLENRPGVAARIFTALADRNLNVDTIIQNVSNVGGADVSFTVPLGGAAPALGTLEAMRPELGFRELSSDDQIGKVTLVGAGMKSRARRRREDVPRARRGGDQPPDDRHEHDPHHGRHRPPRGRARGAGAPRRLRPGAARPRAARRRPCSAPMFNVAVVGATGAVGGTMLRVLEERGFPVTELRPLASARSEGLELDYLGRPRTVRRLTEESFEGIQIALFSAGATRSREFAPAAVEAGAVVIDNSSAYRMDPEVPLVVPEVNEDDLQGHSGIVANPNCVAAPLVVALKPIADAVGLERVVVSATSRSAAPARRR